MHHEFHYLLRLLLLITASIVVYIFATMPEFLPLLQGELKIDDLWFTDASLREPIDSMKTYIRLLVINLYIWSEDFENIDF